MKGLKAIKLVYVEDDDTEVVENIPLDNFSNRDIMSELQFQKWGIEAITLGIKWDNNRVMLRRSGEPSDVMSVLEQTTAQTIESYAKACGDSMTTDTIGVGISSVINILEMLCQVQPTIKKRLTPVLNRANELLTELVNAEITVSHEEIDLASLMGLKGGLKQ